tara:strand:- start:41100 stop:41207 length:108 start_codon:yes stop_codon:yes gene_type:complete
MLTPGLLLDLEISGRQNSINCPETGTEITDDDRNL